MAMFLLAVGAEIKRELVIGERSSRRVAAFPIWAAVGGRVVPAAIFAALGAASRSSGSSSDRRSRGSWMRIGRRATVNRRLVGSDLGRVFRTVSEAKVRVLQSSSRIEGCLTATHILANHNIWSDVFWWRVGRLRTTSCGRPKHRTSLLPERGTRSTGMGLQRGSIVMVAPGSGSRALRERVISVASNAFDVVETGSTRVLPGRRGDVWCGIVVVESVADTRAVEAHWATPAIPVLFVAPHNRANAVHPALVHLDGLLWSSDIERRLAGEIQRVRAGGIRALVRLAATLDGGLTPRARSALLLATRSARPFRTLDALACAAGCGRAALWKAWKKSGPPERPRLAHILDWMLLIEAVSLKQPGLSWVEIAGQLGVHEHTLANIAAKRFGHGLRELSVLPELALSGAAVHDRLIRIFGQETIDQLG
jgi:hypothetical protein